MVPSVLGNLDGVCSLSGSDFGPRRRWQRWERIDQTLQCEGLGAEELALLLAGSLMSENGEVGKGEGECDTAGLSNTELVTQPEDKKQHCSAIAEHVPTNPVVKPMAGACAQ